MNQGVFDTVDDAIQAAKSSAKRVLKIAPWQLVKGNSGHPCYYASTSTRIGSKTVEETGMGRFADKVLKLNLTLDKTPGVEISLPSVKLVIMA